MLFTELLENYRTDYGKEIMFREYPDEKILEWSGEDFYRKVRSQAAVIQNLTKPGQHVGILGNRKYEIFVSIFSIICSGRVAVPMNTTMNAKQLSHFSEMADLELILCENDEEMKEAAAEIHKETGIRTSVIELRMEAAEDWPELNPPKEDALAMMLFSSGTSGMSKIVMLSQKNLTAEENTTSRGRRRRVSHMPLPPYHISCIAGTLIYMGMGDEICFTDSMKYYLRDTEAYRPQHVILVPAIYNLLSHRAEDEEAFLRVLRENLIEIWSVGAPPVSREQDPIRQLNIIILNIYGLTEVSGSAVRFEPQAPGSAGRVMAYLQLRFENGEILLKGDSIMLGYYNDPEQTARVIEDGWFHTGDVGEVDLNGNLYIKGRAKNTIILSNGENVNPEELETELCKSPWISEAFVYAKNDKIFASVVNRKLLLELEEDEKQKIRISIENARKEINRELPPHQKISEMKIREKEFEKTSTGKLKRCRENEE